MLFTDWKRTGSWELLIEPSPISPGIFCWTYTSLLYDRISSTVPQHGALTISKIKIFWSGYRRGSHVWFLSCELNLWTLEERRVRADLIEVYNMMHGLSAVKFESFFELDNNKRTRGHSTHSCKLTKKRFRTDLRQHFFTERIIINVWNSLDEQTVSSCSLNSFKCNLQWFRSHNEDGSILVHLCPMTLEADPEIWWGLDLVSYLVSSCQ